jgi:hypothetical protein
MDDEDDMAFMEHMGYLQIEGIFRQHEEEFTQTVSGQPLVWEWRYANSPVS